MPKTIVGVWIYLCGLVGAVVTGGMLSQVLSAFPSSQMKDYGPIVPGVTRAWAVWLPHTPALLWSSAAVSTAVGLYLWRSQRPVEARLFSAAVVAALNLFLSMFFAVALLGAYFLLPKVANGG